jgi:HlyD family secretion protein
MQTKILRGVALTVIGGALLAACAGGGAPATALTPVIESSIQADSRVIAEGRVVPQMSAALAMPVNGTAREVLVKEGDVVQANQVLLRLDPRRQAAAVAQAEAGLARAQAALNRLKAGVTEEEIRIAEAQLLRAKAQLRQTTGGVTASDIRAAEARLQEAQAQLKELENGGRSNDIAAAEARLDQARSTLETDRDRLSAAKTDAQITMDQAVTALTKAQSAYVVARKDWETVDSTGEHPTQGVRLGEAERRQFYDAFVQAEANLKNAELEVEAARIAFNAAREAEETGVQTGEKRVAEAEANLRRERANTDADELASARAEVADAQAKLDRLRGDERGGAIAGAEAAIAEAEANVAKLRAGASPAAIAEAEAEVMSAEAALQAQQVQLDELELRAPFTGIVAAVDVKIGEYVQPGTAVVQIGDPSVWQIETTDLTELGIVKVSEGAPVTITFDALPGVEMAGQVTRIRSLGENRQGDITYRVIITPNEQDSRLRWNMTASVVIGE